MKSLLSSEDVFLHAEAQFLHEAGDPQEIFGEEGHDGGA